MNASEATNKPVYKRVAEGLIREERTGVYYTRFRQSGKQVRRSLKTCDFQTAKSRLRKLRSDLDAGVVSPLSRPEKPDKAQTSTLQALVERYVSIYNGKAVSTGKRAERYAKSLLRHTGDRPIDQIRTSEIRVWLAEASEGKKGSTLNEYLRVARQLFDLAVKDGEIEDSPVNGIPKFKSRQPARPLPSEEEVERVIAFLRISPTRRVREETADLVEFMAYAGLGQGECGNLHWKDIDFDEGEMHILRQKTGERFIVPIYAKIEPLLRRRFGSGKPLEDRVFAFSDPKKSLERAWAVLGRPHYSPRALRRFFCVRALRMGVDPVTVGRWQGHKDGLLIMRIYGNYANIDHSKEMAKRIA